MSSDNAVNTTAPASFLLEGAALERLRQAAAAFGPQRKLAEAAGLKQSTLSQILAKGGDITLSRAAAIAQALGESLDYLVSGTRPVSNGITMLAVDHQALSAGPGALPEESESEPKEYVPFPEDWLRRHFGKVNGLRLITVVGDSMQPELTDGDWVMIDPSRKKGDGIYAIRHHGVLQVKHLIYEVGGVVIRSANRVRDSDGNFRYREERVDYLKPDANDPANESRLPFEVIGEVVWTGRKSWVP